MDFDRSAFLDALSAAFDMDAADAESITVVVEDMFFGDAEVNDEDLDKETRSLFYSLEAEGLLTFRRTEYKFEGATRRAYFWKLSNEVIAGELGKRIETTDLAEEEQVAKLYAALAEDAWDRDGVVA